ncbi:hypothetical protein ACFPPD_12745 [Cohnella suwonensis]|uniref:Uncharacterized protein n=1 Tax=Cohnella suwonensis TaxID=696072 RepID=A0ABW0LUW7_9BACL
MNRLPNSADGSYSFQVDIKIEAPNQAAALVQLIAALNGTGLDYKIGGQNDKPKTATTAKASAPAKASAAKPPAPPQPTQLELRILHFIESKQLIRLRVNKGRGIKMNIPCRVLNFDSNTSLITVYHVDEKQVYTVGLTEIDDFED